MNKLIFNEKTYIENILDGHNKDTLEITLFQLAQLIAVYMYQEYDISDKEQLEKRINAELELFNFDGYYYEAYYRTIRRIIQGVLKYDIKLKEAYKIPIYRDEYEIIKNCGDKKHQKLLATLYIMARWNGNEFGWTSSKCKINHIKKSANLNVSNKDFCLLIHDLITDGYINNTKKVGKFCFQPRNYNTDKNQEIAFEVDSFDNIGNKFIVSQVNTHISCSLCGKLVKKTSPRMKYCPKCAKEVIRIKNNELQKKKREKSRN